MAIVTATTLLLAVFIGTGQSTSLPDAPIPCAGACPRITYKHYEAKGCEPVFNDEVSACCPASFDCTKAPVRSKDHCYYKGVTYNDGDKIPVANPCEAGCFCSTSLGSPRVECALVECPSLFNPGLRRCKETHTLDSCCPELSECPKEDEVLPAPPPPSQDDASEAVTKTPEAVTEAPGFTCNVEGKEYQLGQEIYPKSEPCTLCVCNENFTDIYGAQCREIECGLDYRDRQELDEGCTPIYFEGRCCPFEWICPDDSRLTTPTVNVRGDEEVTPATHCTLGEISLPLNSTLPTSSPNINCKCETPPDFTCVQYPDEEKAAVAREAGKIEF